MRSFHQQNAVRDEPCMGSRHRRHAWPRAYSWGAMTIVAKSRRELVVAQSWSQEVTSTMNGRSWKAAFRRGAGRWEPGLESATQIQDLVECIEHHWYVCERCPGFGKFGRREGSAEATRLATHIRRPADPGRTSRISRFPRQFARSVVGQRKSRARRHGNWSRGTSRAQRRRQRQAGEEMSLAGQDVVNLCASAKPETASRRPAL